MAATNYYLGIPGRELVPDFNTNSNFTQGAASTATDFVELRIMTIQADGTTKTNITKKDVIEALKAFERWIKEGGLTTGTDNNLPIL